MNKTPERKIKNEEYYKKVLFELLGMIGSGYKNLSEV